MDQLSDSAFKAYRGLVYETQGFRSFFRQASADLAEIAGLKIGRPTRAANSPDAIEDLRAHSLGVQLGAGADHAAGWCSVSRAMEAFEGQGLLRGWRRPGRSSPRRWRTYGVLAKSGMEIAAHATLVEDRPARRDLRPDPRGVAKTHDGCSGDAPDAAAGETCTGLETISRPPSLYRAAQPAPDQAAQSATVPAGTTPDRRASLLSINAIATALRSSG